MGCGTLSKMADVDQALHPRALLNPGAEDLSAKDSSMAVLLEGTPGGDAAIRALPEPSPGLGKREIERRRGEGRVSEEALTSTEMLLLNNLEATPLDDKKIGLVVIADLSSGGGKGKVGSTRGELLELITEPRVAVRASDEGEEGDMSHYSSAHAANVSASELSSRSPPRVRAIYRLGRTLGTGGFATVKHATHRVTGKEFAIKILRLPIVKSSKTQGGEVTSREEIMKEVALLTSMDHPNVVKLYEYYEERTKIYLVMELLKGGELLSAVLERGTYCEEDARRCFLQLILGIEYLHAHNIVHRDLKLENLILATPDDITHIKIADFGLAKHAQGTLLSTICGTPQYVAPEVISEAKGGKYTAAVDLWSAGVILFILLGGYPPFFHESEPRLFDLIRRANFNFCDPVWEAVSEGAKDLIRKLLVANPKNRLTATQVKNHSWMRTTTRRDSLQRTVLKLQTYNTTTKLRTAGFAIIALNRLHDAVIKVAGITSPPKDPLRRHSAGSPSISFRVRGMDLHTATIEEEAPSFVIDRPPAPTTTDRNSHSPAPCEGRCCEVSSSSGDTRDGTRGTSEEGRREEMRSVVGLAPSVGCDGGGESIGEVVPVGRLSDSVSSVGGFGKQVLQRLSNCDTSSQRLSRSSTQRLSREPSRLSSSNGIVEGERDR